MSKRVISESQLHDIIKESIYEAMQDEGIGHWLGNAYQTVKNKWNNFKGDFRAGQNKARYDNRDYDSYSEYGDGDEFRNFGGNQYGAHRWNLTNDRAANARQWTSERNPWYTNQSDNAAPDNQTGNGGNTPPAGQTTPPADQTGSGGNTPPPTPLINRNTPPAGQTGNGGNTPPAGQTTPPAGQTGNGGNTPPAGQTGNTTNQGNFEVQNGWGNFLKKQGITPANKTPNGKMYQNNRGQSTNVDRLSLKKNAENKMTQLGMYNAGTPQYPNWRSKGGKMTSQQKAAKQEWMRYANNVGIRENKIQKIVSESIKKVLNEQNGRRHK